MPLEGEYEPSTLDWVREQVEQYESSGGTEALTLRDTGLPVVVVTSIGASSGKLRKSPLMRVEHDGSYLAVGSQGGAPTDPHWVRNVRAHPRVELQDGTRKWEMSVRMECSSKHGDCVDDVQCQKAPAPEGPPTPE